MVGVGENGGAVPRRHDAGRTGSEGDDAVVIVNVMYFHFLGVEFRGSSARAPVSFDDCLIIVRWCN